MIYIKYQHLFWLLSDSLWVIYISWQKWYQYQSHNMNYEFKVKETSLATKFSPHTIDGVSIWNKTKIRFVDHIAFLTMQTLDLFWFSRFCNKIKRSYFQMSSLKKCFS